MIDNKSNLELEVYLMNVSLKCNRNNSIITEKMSKKTEISKKH